MLQQSKGYSRRNISRIVSPNGKTTSNLQLQQQAHKIGIAAGISNKRVAVSAGAYLFV